MIITKEEILELYKEIMIAFNQEGLVLNKSLLDSCVNSIYQTFEGNELYPTKEDKVIRLYFNLISNHCFTDGNKRIGFYVYLYLTIKYKLNLELDKTKLYDTTLELASGKLTYEDILDLLIIKDDLTKEEMNEMLNLI